MVSSEQNKQHSEDDLKESEVTEHISIPEPDQDRNKLVGKSESVKWKRGQGGEHSVKYYFFPYLVGYIWGKGFKVFCEGNLEWQGFEKYIFNNHKKDAASFAEGSIDWDELVLSIEEGVRQEIGKGL